MRHGITDARTIWNLCLKHLDWAGGACREGIQAEPAKHKAQQDQNYL